MIDCKMFRNKIKLKMLFYRPSRREDWFFENIYGYHDVRRLFGLALESNHNCSILLTGPPASAKTLFLQSLMKLKGSHFIDCSSASKSGIVDYIFENRPKYLLNLMETGIVSETKYNKTRKIEIKTSVFATCNSVERIIPPLQSRFFVVKLQGYTYEQFYEITVKLLTSDQYNVDEEIAQAVWKTSRNNRNTIKIAKMAKSVEDVNWILSTF